MGSATTGLARWTCTCSLRSNCLQRLTGLNNYCTCCYMAWR